jgi:opacity protein-like surface antigen
MISSSISKNIAGITGRLSMRFSTFAVICLVTFAGARLQAQAVATASSAGALQIGGTFNLARSGYDPPKYYGYGFYSTFDIRYRWGIEAEFHQVNDSDKTTVSYERTYEIGPRYVRRYGRLAPYAKLMYGRGVFNWSYAPTPGNPDGGTAANLAYNIGAVGAGLDYTLLQSLNLRADYEFQRWLSFPDGLNPSILSVGVAYRFH